ncbi:MAG: hypothetical protein ABI567_00065 [Gammaproteobacteria bacterium]
MTPTIGAETYVPEALKAWAPWVLDGEDFHRCPFLNGQDPKTKDSHVCAWPGRLVLTAGIDSAHFSQDWDVRTETWADLPGDGQLWPVAVIMDGRPAAVIDRKGTPSLRLAAGTHTLSGTINWARRPAQLAVPASAGIVKLTMDGKAVLRPGRDGNHLWLGERPGEAPTQDSVDVRAYRLLTDEIPMGIETQLRLDVSGQGREEVLKNVLQPGFIAVALESELPARVEADGSLRIQLRPGRWELTLVSRATGLPDEIQPQVTAPEEIWSYRSNDRRRTTVLEGAAAVDPIQTGVPDDWAELPSFRVVSGNRLKVAVRGEVGGAETNQLQLQRQIWRDFDDSGYTTVDRVTGQMRQGWRLDMRAPFTMESAQSDDTNLLVTHGGAGLTGIEIRATEPTLQVVGRVPATRPGGAATGYTQRFDSVSAVLHLPPAHRLLWARGADRAPEAWVNLWTLLDLFLLLLIAVGTGRLLGPMAGGIAFLALLLTYHESGAPVWAWVNLLAALGLAKYLPEGRFRHAAVWYRHLSALALIALLVPFVANQARLLLHPQLERELVPQISGNRAYFLDERNVPVAESPSVESPAASSVGGVGEMVVTTRRQAESAPRYAPDALVQTGPGIPDWRWHAYELGWSGPVAPDDTLSLWIIGRPGTAIARLLGIALSVALLALLLKGTYRGRWRVPAGMGGLAMLLVGLALLVPASPVAAANDPDAELLAELKRRLTLPPECAPKCAVIESAAVTVENDRVTARLRVTSEAATAVALPSAGDAWEPDAVTNAGGTPLEIYRDRQDGLWAPVAPGVTDIFVTGSLTGLDALTITFPERPRNISATARGWVTGGVHEGHLSAGAIELSRIRTGTGSDGTALAGGSFPPFARVERRLRFNLDWGVDTTVTRVAPARDAINLAIDLLPGESVTTADIDVRDGKARVSLAAGEDEVSWHSTLPRSTTLTLKAAQGQPWTEVWLLIAGPTWHLDYTGMSPVAPDSPDMAPAPEFQPRPGDSLAVTITRPEAVAGATLAIDVAHLETTAGQRSSDTALSFTYRSTRGGQQKLTLPAEAVLQSLTVDGQPLPARPRDGALELSLLPGQHDVAMGWRREQPVGVQFATPPVGLGVASANVNLSIQLPSDRWSLLAFGPGTGPAFLYWGELAVFLIVAVALGRTRWSPLRTHEWLLLGLGFSTFSWALLLLVTVWFFALRWRGTMAELPASEARKFNAIQVALGALTVVAVGALVSGIPQALLGNPDMHIVGDDSIGNHLSWFTDRSADGLPQARVLSVDIWWYKGVMLAWALWIVFAFLRWLPWAWENYSRGGLWRGRIARVSVEGVNTNIKE